MERGVIADVSCASPESARTSLADVIASHHVAVLESARSREASFSVDAEWRIVERPAAAPFSALLALQSHAHFS